jgi:hypothetical protein
MDPQSETVKTPRVARPPETVAEASEAPRTSVERLRGLWSRGRAWAAARPRTVAKAAALLIYLLISLVYFWWPIRGHFRDHAISAPLEATQPDLGQALWYLRWWPYALTHGLNPFVTYEIWHAHGYNTMWQVSIPGLALAAWPVTATLGVVAAYNTIIILSFTLTAWATFFLCYHLTSQIWPSLIGGYLFGYCGYMLSQGTGHPHLIVLFPIPITIYLAILRYEGRISRVLFLALTPLPLAFLFLVSLEEFALVALYAYLALGLWALFHWSAWRESLRVAIEGSVAYLFAAVLLSPFLYYIVIGYTTGVVHTTGTYSSDLLGFFIPTDVFWAFSKYFRAVPLAGGNLAERDSYIGLPLALLMLAFAYERWRTPSGKFLAILALISFAFSLGPMLIVANVPTISIPIVAQAFRAPILQKALPIRFALFLDLFGAIMAAVWLAQNVRWRVSKAALGLILVVMIIPNVGAGLYKTSTGVPEFFSTTLYQRYIAPGANILILPLGSYSREAMWQQATSYSFTLATGYGISVPHPEEVLPIVLRFGTRGDSPNIPQPVSAAEANAYQYYVEQYLATEHITGVVMREGFETQFSQYFAFLHEDPVHTGGVWYYAIPSAISQASLPAEQVAGETIARMYEIGPAASWDEAAQEISAPAGASGVAAQTWADSFAGGTYTLTLAIQSAGATPLAHAEVVVNGQVTTVPLVDGTTRASLSIPGKSGSLVIRIVSDGGGFSVGDATLTKES